MSKEIGSEASNLLYRKVIMKSELHKKHNDRGEEGHETKNIRCNCRSIILYNGDNLFDAGILDSLQVVNLIAELEDALDIDIDAAYVVEDNFKTKEAIIAMIEMII